MVEIYPDILDKNTTFSRIQRFSTAWIVWFLGILALSLLLATIMLKRGPDWITISWLIYFAGAIGILFQPRYGIYLSLFFGLLGDAALMPGYPFIKNFSSKESVFYLNDALIISPLEIYILLMFLSWIIRGVIQRKLIFYKGPLFWPALVFLMFVVSGLAYGILTGGNVNIALWEARSIFYLVAMLLLVSNLITEREHYSHLIWAAMLGLLVESIIGDSFYLFKLNRSLAGVDAITEHSAAVHMNTVFIFALAVWIFKSSLAKRLFIPMMVPIIALTYLATQRRAAFITLGFGLLLVLIVLFKENRRLFYYVAPLVLFLGGLYLTLFWNSYGALGLPAQAFKSVFFEEQANVADYSSNVYRVLENINISFTIHRNPLTGVGFGQKFYIIVPLPDISVFEWWEYLTHNSILWFWMKTGIGGFMALLFLIGASIMVGARVIWRAPKDDLSAIALVACLYIVMHFIYAYVDISWDVQSMLYVGTMMGILNSMEHVIEKPVDVPEKRWEWQKDPEPVPELLAY